MFLNFFNIFEFEIHIENLSKGIPKKINLNAIQLNYILIVLNIIFSCTLKTLTNIVENYYRERYRRVIYYVGKCSYGLSKQF